MTVKEKHKIDELEHKIERLLFILDSDKKTNTKGLVEKVNTINKSLNELLVREKIYKTKAGTWGAVGGIIGGGVIWIAKTIILKLV